MTLRERIMQDLTIAKNVADDAPWLCILGTGAVMEAVLFQFFHLETGSKNNDETTHQAVQKLAGYQEDGDRFVHLRDIVCHARDSGWISGRSFADIRGIYKETNTCRHRAVRPDAKRARHLSELLVDVLEELSGLALFITCLKCREERRLRIEDLLSSSKALGAGGLCPDCKKSMVFDDFDTWKKKVRAKRNYPQRTG